MPDDWVSGTLNDFVGPKGIFLDGDWVESKDQDPDGAVRLIQLADIGDGCFRNKSKKFLTQEKAKKLRCTFLQTGDLLIARMPDPLGRACIFPGDSKNCVTAVDVCIFRPGIRDVDNYWFMYAVNALPFRNAVASLQSGSTRKRISRKNLGRVLLPLPPFPEQRRIVAKIEELFTRLDAGMKALKAAKAQIKRYRQAVLKAAFSGELTKEWRDAELKKPDSPLRKEPASVLLECIKSGSDKVAKKGKNKTLENDDAELPDLPKSWVWALIKEAGKVITGTTPSKANIEYYGKDCPFFKPTDLNAGYYVKEASDNLSSKGLERARLLPAKSILVTCIGATIGKTGFTRIKGSCNQQINAIVPNEAVIPEFVYFVCISPQFQKFIKARASSTTLPILNKSRFEMLAFPLASQPEQQKIVEEIERRFSVADESEKELEPSLREVERLRRSILKRTFEGKLVPQDPNDEPASVLLERIKAERVRLESEKKTKKRPRRKRKAKSK